MIRLALVYASYVLIILMVIIAILKITKIAIEIHKLNCNKCNNDKGCSAKEHNGGAAWPLKEMSQ